MCCHKISNNMRCLLLNVITKCMVLLVPCTYYVNRLCWYEIYNVSRVNSWLGWNILHVFMTQYSSFSEHLILLWHWFYNHIIQACIHIGIWERLLIWPLITCLSIQYLNNIYLLYKLLQHLFIFIDFENESYINGRGRQCSDCIVVELNYPWNQCLSPLTRPGEVYSKHHYVITFGMDLQQVGGFLGVLWIPPPIKLKASI